MADETTDNLVNDQAVVPGAGADQGAAAPQPGGEAPGSPRSLEDAFRLVREADRGAAPSDVEEQRRESAAGEQGEHGDDGGSPASVPPDASDSGGADAVQGHSDQARQQQQQRVQPAGNQLEQLIQTFQRQAVDRTRADFREQGFSRLSLGDLYVQDEQTGRVSFNNPDDPQRPFTSRVEAQAYVDAYNRGFDEEERAYAQQAYNSILEDNRDVISLVAFNPIYQQMPAEVRQYFDALIAPYEQTNPDGTITFPGVDFQKVMGQAQNLVALDASRAAQAAAQSSQENPEPPKKKGPALDLKGASANRADRPVPTTIGEAMALINEQRAEKRKRKGGRR